MTSHAMTVKHGYTPDEVGSLFRLEKAGFSPDFRWSKKDFIEGLKTCDLIQGVYEGKLVGYVLSEVKSGVVHILSLTVDPVFRRMGFGGKLMHEMEEHYRNQGAKKVVLEVHVNNAAQLLYFKLDYRVCGFKPKYYSNKSPAILMGKLL